MVCRHCGFKVPEGSEFCDNCGHRINSVDLKDKLDGFREDDITHAGEQPRKTDIFSNRVQDVPGTAGRKVRKPTSKKTKRSSSNKGASLGKVLLPILFFIIYIVIQVLTEVLE